MGFIAVKNVMCVRHIIINALRNDKSIKKSIKAKRYKATLETEYAEKILGDIF